MNSTSAPEQSSQPMRASHAAGLGATIHQALPSGWHQITNTFQQNEGWMLQGVVRDLSGNGYGQNPKCDGVSFALLDGFGGIAVIRPLNQLKLNTNEAARK